MSEVILRVALMATLVAACTDGPGNYEPVWKASYDASVGADATVTPFECPRDGVIGKGRHRLFVQGHNGTPDAEGVYPLLHERILEGDPADAAHCDDAYFVDDANDDGVWQPGEEPKALGPSDLVHGEHFLVGPGAYAEFSTVLCDDITGDITFYVPNFDVAGSESLHQLFVIHDGEEFLIGQAVDDEAGQSGYNPFIRQISGDDPEAVAGDTLLLRSTNLNGYQFSVMVWYPPSQYESWILVTVP